MLDNMIHYLLGLLLYYYTTTNEGSFLILLYTRGAQSSSWRSAGSVKWSGFELNFAVCVCVCVCVY